MSVIIKAHLQKTDSTSEVRRIPVTVNSQDSSGIFKEVAAKIGSAFPGLSDKLFTLKWRDSDGDLVIMSTDEEMIEAISHSQNSPLKVFITVDGVKEVRPDKVLDSQSESSEEPAMDEDKTDESTKCDAAEDQPFFGFMGMPFGRPPPPGFEFGTGFCGRMGGRKRGHPDGFNHHGCPDFPFGPRGGHGPHGHHFGPFGRGHHFGSQGERGHHFGHHGPRGHHFGHHMGVFGPFGGAGFFEGPPSPFPFPGSDMHFNHHFKHHFGHRHHHHGDKHEKEGWKSNLREAVPVAHRRWAKAYIRNWRVLNLKNATSTSSDSDKDDLIFDNSSVPEAYAKWLEVKLHKWHKRWGQEASADGSADKKENKEEKDKLKASVPVEFRKWTKWYLSRHFGKKEAPKFRKSDACPSFGGKVNKCGKKDWKKACKMQTLGVSIPVTHRMWAKIFIRDWRQEHNIPDPKNGASGVVSSESEDTEKETQDVTVPNDYIRWMRKFLARWHLWRGEGLNVEVEKGGMGEFKDTVPRNFRKWVKCFLWRRYGNGVAKEVDTASQYQKWLQAFQKKWLHEKRKDSTDELILTSSDDEAVGPTSDDEKVVESSLKKLRLENENDGTKKTVHFNPTTEAVNTEGAAGTRQTDIGDYEGALFHKKMNPGFRNWAKEALWQWDGKTAGQTEGDNGSEQIPPHVYHWMSKMMMKMQMKKMKKELKQAKHAMKASKK